MSTVILVTSHGLQPEQTTTFWNSLQQSGYDGDVVLFTNDLEVSFPNLIKIPWNEDSTYFRSSRRLFLYYSFLKYSSKTYDTVITSGIRDVLFQDNPSNIEHGPADLFMEHQGPTLAQCPYNSRWLKTSYGDHVVDNPLSTEFIGNRAIICAEIMIGTHAGMQTLLEQLTQEALVHTRKEDLEDQAILNYMYWTGKLSNIAFALPNENSPVYTVGYLPHIKVSKHRILNNKGEVPTIVHQYDRHV